MEKAEELVNEVKACLFINNKNNDWHVLFKRKMEIYIYIYKWTG